MKTIIISAICLALLAGCQQIEEVKAGNEWLSMSLETSIGNPTYLFASRYSSSDGTSNNLSFDNGDRIGVFMADRPVVEWTKENNGWNAGTAVYWPDTINLYDFYAYYPYVDSDSKEEIPMPSLTDQKGTVAGLSDCDFLVATTNQSYGSDGVVSFTGDASFKHISSLLAITVKGTDDLKASTIKKISLGAENIASATTYSFQKGIVSVKEQEKLHVLESAKLDLTMTGASHTFYFIVNSGIALGDMALSIKYSVENVNYEASKTGLGAVTLVGGNQYGFNLNITDGVLSITGGNVKDWGSGGEMDDIIINKLEEENL